MAEILLGATLTEVEHTGAYIVSERHFYSRDEITFTNPQSAAIPPGTVIGKVGVAADETAVAAADAGNTGIGVLTMDGTAPIADGAIDGVYQVIARTAGATGEFEVMDPNGIVVGEGAIGTTFSGPVKFLWADGSTHAVVDDRWLITVARPSGKADLWGPLDLTRSDGMNVAQGVLYELVPANDTAVQVTATVRESEVRATDLTWPSGATTAQIAEGTNQLQRAGIILR
jgi:hypothetical protein